MRGLVPAKSHGDKSNHVNWPLWLQNLVAGTKSLVPVTSFTNSNQFEFWGKSRAQCDLLLKKLCVNCSWNKSL